MRGAIGVTYQHKLSESDKTSTMRSLFQLSCIDPVKRDPVRFQLRTPEGEVLNPTQAKDYCRLHPENLDAQRRLAEIDKNFEDFCREHPQLVRRLSEGLRSKMPGQWWQQFRCKTPDEVVQYLADNYKVPCLYEEPKEGAGLESDKSSTPKPPEKRFPLLPPPKTEGVRPAPPQQLFDPSELTYESELGDDVDPYVVARAWYGYAQEPLPEPDPEQPGQSKPIQNRNTQRIGPYTTVIFRDTPARAQSHVADRLEEEGWFDGTGWKITDWFERDRFSNGEPAVVGRDRNWAADAWSQGLRDVGELRQSQRPAGFAGTAGESRRAGDTLSGRARVETGRAARRRPAARAVRGPARRPQGPYVPSGISLLPNGRRISRITISSAQTELRPETVTARKHLFDAENLRLTGRNTQAEEMYRKAFGGMDRPAQGPP